MSSNLFKKVYTKMSRHEVNKFSQIERKQQNFHQNRMDRTLQRNISNQLSETDFNFPTKKTFFLNSIDYNMFCTINYIVMYFLYDKKAYNPKKIWTQPRGNKNLYKIIFCFFLFLIFTALWQITLFANKHGVYLCRNYFIFDVLRVSFDSAWEKGKVLKHLRCENICFLCYSKKLLFELCYSCFVV